MTSAESSAAPPRQQAPSAEQLPPLVARTPLGIFDEAITLLRIRPLFFLGTALLAFVPARGFALLAPGADLRGVRLDQFFDILIANVFDSTAVTATVVRLGLESLALFIVATVFAEVVATWFTGQSLPNRTLALNAAKRFPAIGLAWVLTKAAMVVSAPLTAGIMALFFGAFFAVVAPIMGAEGLGPIDAIRRSMQLATSRMGQVILTFIVTGVGALIIRTAVRSTPALILGQFGLTEQLPDWLVGGLFEVVSGVVSLAFVAAASVVLYLDLRVRREGIDLTLAVNDLFSRKRGGVRG